MNKIFGVFGLVAWAGMGSAQIVTSRYSQLNYDYVYGGGGDTHTGSSTDERFTLVPTDSASASFSGYASGLISNSVPYSGGVRYFGDQGFTLFGGPASCAGITAAGNTQASAASSGVGAAVVHAANPGNQIGFNFTLATAASYELRARLSCPGYNTPGEIYLQYFNGFNWAYVNTTLFLSNGQGNLAVTGVLNPGDYRIYGGVSINAGSPQSYDGHFFYALTFPTTTSLVRGHVFLADYQWPVDSEPIRVEIRNASGSLLEAPGTLYVHNDGEIFGASNVVGNDLTLTFRGRTWLQRSVHHVNLLPGSANATVVNLTLPNGDADHSGEVDAADIDLVIAHFGEVGPGLGYTREADLDGSAEVDAADIDLCIANFGALDE